MSQTRYASILGLGFGDCGKGRFVDSLARRWQASTVVRFNGGAQAGHNVVTFDSPFRHHTFSQFGSGTFLKGVRTLLADPFVLHPTSLLVEAGVLASKGVNDALSRLHIDGACRVTTPFHQSAGRLRELLRGSHRHGSCGVGFGETVRQSLQHPELVLRYGEFADLTSLHTRHQLEKLESIRSTLLEEFLPFSRSDQSPEWSVEFQTLEDDAISRKWLTQCHALARECPPANTDLMHALLTGSGCVLFEGAQGVLLDEWRGFHPHTTWSSISTSAVEDLTQRFGIRTSIEHYGVLRSYLTRHGSGPLPTHDARLDALIDEPHNSSQGWQGSFRRGHPDAVLLRYAIESVGQLSGLLVSHLDVFERDVGLKWCEGYSTPEIARLDRLPLSLKRDLNQQSALTELLFGAEPRFAFGSIHSAQELLEWISTISSIPIRYQSFGPNQELVSQID